MKRIAVVGFGFMGQTHTINILNSDDFELVAIVDKNIDNIENKVIEPQGNFSAGNLGADWLKGIRLYSELSACLKHEKPDAVVLSVHTNLHYALCRQALEAGLHVFLEKPFVLDPAEGEKLIQLANSHHCRLMIGHVVRFIPAYLKLKDYIDSGVLGELEFLSLTRFSGVPAWGEWKARQADFGSSGGALFDLVIHDIDFAQWACGVPDTIWSRTLPGKLSHHDFVSAFWEYKSKPLIVKVEGGNIFHTPFPFEAGFSARFEKASLVWSTGQPDHIKVTRQDDLSNIPVGDSGQGFIGEMSYFGSLLSAATIPPHCTPESALETIRLCHRHI